MSTWHTPARVARCLPNLRPPASAARMRKIQRLTLDYAGTHCSHCGKHPLNCTNRSGYCRECSRRHVRLYKRTRPDKGLELGR